MTAAAAVVVVTVVMAAAAVVVVSSMAYSNCRFYTIEILLTPSLCEEGRAGPLRGADIASCRSPRMLETRTVGHLVGQCKVYAARAKCAHESRRPTQFKI